MKNKVQRNLPTPSQITLNDSKAPSLYNNDKTCKRKPS